MNRIGTILFDWDGTLLDSYLSGFQASMAVFRHFGIQADRQRFLATYHPNWYETYRTLGLPEREWPEADRLWLDSYHRNPPRLYPFTRNTIDTLARRGYTLGVVTSGNRERVNGEVARHGLGGLFSVLICHEDTELKKPHPEPLVAALMAIGRAPSESVYVGDRPEDVRMGQQANVYTVAVESAYSSREDLEAAEPNLLLPHAGHLPDRFGPLHG